MLALTAHNSMVRRNFCGLSKQGNFLYLIELIYDKVFDYLIASGWLFTFALNKILFVFIVIGRFFPRKLNRMVTETEIPSHFGAKCSVFKVNTTRFKQFSGDFLLPHSLVMYYRLG